MGMPKERVFVLVDVEKSDETGLAFVYERAEEGVRLVTATEKFAPGVLQMVRKATGIDARLFEVVPAMGL